MKPLLIVYRPTSLTFEVGEPNAMARKGVAALNLEFQTGNENPACLVGEAGSPTDALREVQKIIDEWTKTKAKPCCFFVKMVVWSGNKGEEAKWN